MRRSLQLLVIVLIMFFSWVVLYSELIYLPRIENRLNDNKFYYPRFLYDLKTLEKDLPFEKPVFEKDISSLVTSKVPFRTGAQKIKLKELGQMEAVFSKYLKWRVDKDQFAMLVNDPEILNIDTSWIESIDSYTHWDLTSNPVVQERLKNIDELGGVARVRVLNNLPVPDFTVLRRWAVVYVIQKALKGDSVAGLSKYRKLSKLAFSTQSLNGNIIASSMLKYEHLFTEYFEIKSWKTYPKDKIRKFNKIVTAWTGVWTSLWHEGFNEEFKKYMRPELGFCPAIVGSDFGKVFYEEYLKKRLFFETELTSKFEDTRHGISYYLKSCNLTKYNVFLSDIPFEAEKWSKIPVFGRLTGLYLMQRSILNYFMLYANEK